MTVPWLAAIGVEYLLFRWFFAADLAAPARPEREAQRPNAPVFAVVIVAATLAGFVVTSLSGVNPAWAALAGASVLAARGLGARRTTVRSLASAVNAPFLLFVLALGVVARAVVDNGLGSAIGQLLPSGSSLLALLGVVAAFAAALANLINNLPAVLMLLPIAAMGGTGPVLATLIGVNLGPNLTYIGSLATLLWRRVLRAHDSEPVVGEFTRLGLLAVPTTLVASVVALWAMLGVIGG